MNQYYGDIIEKMGPPTWWDDFYPRYCEFAPDEVSNIYSDEVALVEIACQSCQKRFRMALGRSQWTPPSLSSVIGNGSFYYGDPPNTRCCLAGPTMSCLNLRVLEFWRRAQEGFVRVPELEIELDKDRSAWPVVRQYSL